jgi:hypothetical protein
MPQISLTSSREVQNSSSRPPLQRQRSECGQTLQPFLSKIRKMFSKHRNRDIAPFDAQDKLLFSLA